MIYTAMIHHSLVPKVRAILPNLYIKTGEDGIRFNTVFISLYNEEDILAFKLAMGPQDIEKDYLTHLFSPQQDI